MILLSASKVWLWVQRWRFLKFPDMDQKIINRFTSIWKWVLRWWKRPFWFSKKVNSTLSLSLNWLMPYQGGCSQFLISSKGFDSSICDWKNKLPCLGTITSFALTLTWVDFRCVHRLQLLKCLQPLCHPSKFTPSTKRIRGTIQVRLSFQIDGFLTGPSQL